MTVEPEYEDLARELHAMRAEPRREYARELDARAAEWLRERPRRRLPSLRLAIPAAATAAAAVAVALVVAGGDGGGGGGGPERLVVAVVSAEAPPPAAGGAGEALQAPLERESKTPATDDARTPDVLALENFRAPADGRFVVSYQAAERTGATVELAGAAAKVTLDPGTGNIEVGVEGLPAGTHRLEISMRGVKVLSERVEIDG